MGSFYFKCLVSDRLALGGAEVEAKHGDVVHLFLLDKGKVVEYMYGNYSSYGTVYDVETDIELSWLANSEKLIDGHFERPQHDTGVALILGEHWKEGDELPTTVSEITFDEYAVYYDFEAEMEYREKISYFNPSDCQSVTPVHRIFELPKKSCYVLKHLASGFEQYMNITVLREFKKYAKKGSYKAIKLPIKNTKHITSDYVCIDCGCTFLTEKQKAEGGVATVSNGTCGRCQIYTGVIHKRKYNYLRKPISSI